MMRGDLRGGGYEKPRENGAEVETETDGIADS
jgi:hypothetical protein